MNHKNFSFKSFPLILTSLFFLSACGGASGQLAASSSGVESTAITSSGNAGINATPTPAASPGVAPTATPVANVAIYRSCKEILQANLASPSGTYTIYLGSVGTNTTQVYCDMTTEGGGWTVILDGANADRAALNKFFDNTSVLDVPDSQFVRDATKGIFWTANQYFVAKNMPASSEIRVTFSLSYTDPTFGTNCYAILGLLSPTGYLPGVANSFTAFAQKNDTSSYVKATYNLSNTAENQSVQVNATAAYPYPFVNGSRIFAGNPYGFGNTCTTFFFKRVMIR